MVHAAWIDTCESMTAQVGEEVLGVAAKVEVSKESTTIVGDGSSEDAVKARVKQIKNMIAETEQDYEREKLNERVARLSGGVAIIQVGAQTETELKEKKLRVEDALNATKARPPRAAGGAFAGRARDGCSHKLSVEEVLSHQGAPAMCSTMCSRPCMCLSLLVHMQAVYGLSVQGQMATFSAHTARP